MKKKQINILFLLLTLIIFITFSLLIIIPASSSNPEIIETITTLYQRTSYSDIYLNTISYEDGTTGKFYTAYISPKPINIFDENLNEYVPFTDAVNFSWQDSNSFLLQYKNINLQIKPLIIDDNNIEYSINEIKNNYPELIFSQEIKKSKAYKYGITLDNIPLELQEKIKQIKFSIENLQGITLDEIKQETDSIIIKDKIKLYFGDISIYEPNLNYNIPDKTSVIIENVSDKNKIIIDPTITLTDITEDGYIEDSGTKTRINSGYYLYIGYFSPEYYRSYLEFDTSSISESAKINKVNLNISVYDPASYYCDIKEIEKQVGTQTDDNLWNDIENGTLYLTSNPFCTTTGWKNVDISSANLTLQNQLDENWFALGIKTNNESTNYGIFWSSEHTDSPELIITYSYNQAPNIILNSPLNDSIVSNYALLNFTISDPDSDLMEVWVYGSDNISNLNNNLLYHKTNQQDGTYTYNWTAPLVQPEQSTILLLHFDNNSKFNENNNLIYDFSGNSNNATAQAAVWNETGKFAGAFEFNGIKGSRNMTIEHSNSFNLTNITISFWFMKRGAGTSGGWSGLGNNNYPLTSKGAGGGDGTGVDATWFIGVNSSNNLVAGFESLTGTDYNLKAGITNIQDNVWYYLVYVRNYSMQALYLNGELEASMTTNSNAANNALDIGIGQATCGGTCTYPNGAWNGTIDELAIFNRTLNEDEIKNYYTLKHGIRYYWKVNVSDSWLSNESDVWQFLDADPILCDNPAGTLINKCGNFIDSNCIYLLTADIKDKEEGCFIITANNVTLDCQNHIVDGNDLADYGIYVSRANSTITNITIKDCTITDWDSAGIYFFNAKNNKLENLNVNSNPDDGVYFYGSNSIINNSYFNNNGDEGINLDFSSNNTIINCSINNNNRGIYIAYSQNNNITNSHIENNNYGIYFDSSDVQNNRIFNNFFNNENNSYFSVTTPINYFNITLQSGTNIVGGNQLGGNFWAKPDGTGFSQTCADTNSNGICDSAYNITTDSACTIGVNCGNNTDYLPLTYENVAPNVSLISPQNNSISTKLNITFICNATDNTGLKNMSLYFRKMKTAYFRDNDAFVNITNDTTLNADNPTQNYGSDTFIRIDGDPHIHSIIKFPNIFGSGEGQIPLVSKIISANLSLNISDQGSSILAYRLKEDWNENETTWNKRTATLTWTDAGANGSTSSDSSYSERFIVSSKGIHNYSITRFVQNWSNGLPNFGIVLTDTGIDGVRINSSEAANEDALPLLKVIYYEPIWYLNQTNNVSGIQNLTEFNVTLEDDSTYEWTCEVYDAAGNYDWADENRTLIIRDDPPVALAIGSNNSNPLLGEWVEFYSQWTDDENLSSYIFSWQVGGNDCNDWVNNPPVAFNSALNPGNWTNTTMQIPATCNNKLINFSFWANDSENQWNQIIEPIAVGCIVNITYYQYPTVSFLNETIEIIGFEAGDIIVAPYYQAVNASIDYGLTTSYGGYTENKTFKQRHEFNLSGLTPNKKYFYRVNLAYDLGSCHYTDNKFNSSFNTSDDTDTSFTFAVIGDMRAQAGTGVQTNIFSKLTSYIMQRNPDFVINVGDVVESQQSGLGDNYSIARSAWKEYTDVVWNLTDHIPTFISIGNHEHPGTQNSLKRYREVVIHPQNGNGSNDAGCYQNNCYNETTYWFRYGNSLFVSLNTEEKPDRNIANITGNQYKWFNQTVNQTGYTHKFVFAHRPLAGTNRSDSLFGKDPTWSAHLDELMYNNGVTAAFYGHEHTYCKNTTHNGEMLHVISGGGGAPLHDLKDCFAVPTDMYNKTYHYIMVNITGNVMNATVYNYTNDVVNSFKRTMG